jgi:uncharacterized protein (DUF952 family)
MNVPMSSSQNETFDPERVTTIYRLLRATDYREARALGIFRGSEHDLRDGFIHFSAAHQVAETAAKHYAAERDLVLLFVDVASVEDSLRWEVSRNGERFPHLYAELSFDAVRRVLALELDAEGRHRFPPLD